MNMVRVGLELHQPLLCIVILSEAKDLLFAANCRDAHRSSIETNSPRFFPAAR
jgi:hypothetical protein